MRVGWQGGGESFQHFQCNQFPLDCSGRVQQLSVQFQCHPQTLDCSERVQLPSEQLQLLRAVENRQKKKIATALSAGATSTDATARSNTPVQSVSAGQLQAANGKRIKGLGLEERKKAGNEDFSTSGRTKRHSPSPHLGKSIRVVKNMQRCFQDATHSHQDIRHMRHQSPKSQVTCDLSWSKWPPSRDHQPNHTPLLSLLLLPPPPSIPIIHESICCGHGWPRNGPPALPSIGRRANRSRRERRGNAGSRRLIYRSDPSHMNHTHTHKHTTVNQIVVKKDPDGKTERRKDRQTDRM